MEEAAVLVERQDGIATVRLNRPQRRNAFTDIAMIDGLADTMRVLDRDREVKCIVLTGNGSAFSAGGDLKSMLDGSSLVDRERPEATRMAYRRGIQQLPELFEALEVPVIAAVNGPAMGAGCDLAMMCDIRIASQTARFAQTFVTLGLVSGDGGAWLLSRTMSFADACEMAFTGETVDAARALEIGLVSRIAPAERLMDEVMSLARRIAQHPADGLRMTKRLLRMGRNMQMNHLLEVSAAMQALVHNTDEHRTALASAYERISRKPAR
jgi:enoyl-CoA hydratase/carnithine racemase